MACPTEFECSVFADGELPEAEARAVARHLETCAACRSLVDAICGENRVLVHCLQDVDLEDAAEAVAPPAAAPAVVARLALSVLGIATAFRIGTNLFFGLGLPEGLEWLNSQTLGLNLNVLATAIVSAFQGGGVAMADTVRMAALGTLAGLVLVGMSRVLSRRFVVNGMFGTALMVGVLSQPAYATDYRRGAAASLPAGETVDDSVIAIGERNTTIAGTVTGDLVVFGDTITVSGSVEGNVVVFARRLDVTGVVGGTIVGAASVVQVSGQVGRNLLAGASNVTIDPPAQVGGNVISFAGDTIVSGTIRRDLSAFSGALEVRNAVDGDVSFRGGQLYVSAPARIGGDVVAYVEDEENVSIDAGAVVTGSTDVRLREPGERPSRFTQIGFYLRQLLRIAAAFVTGLLLFWLAPALTPRGMISGVDWLKAGGIGFIALVTVPVAAVITAITLIGLPLAFSAFILWLAGLYLAKIFVAQFIGRSLVREGSAMPLLAGLVLVVAAVNLPLVGGAINFLLTLLGLGMIVMAAYAARGARRDAVSL